MTILIITEELKADVYSMGARHRVFTDGAETLDEYRIGGPDPLLYHGFLVDRAVKVTSWNPGDGPDPLDTPMGQ